MSFVYPSFLWAFAVLLIPIIVHLFNFRRYKTIYFSSIQFIKKVDKETNATKSIKHYLVLASRLLAFTCIVLAFAQPYIPTAENNESADSVLAVYLDNSYSMSAKGTNGSLLNHAKESLRNIVQQQSKEQKYVLVTNELSGIEHRLLTANEITDRLETVTLSPITRSPLQPLRSMRNFLTKDGFSGNLQFLALSDFQNNKPLSTKEIDTTAYYTFLKFSPQTERNLFIDSVWYDQPFQRKGVNSTMNIRVHNYGNSSVTNAEIKLNVGKTNRQALVDIPANDQAIVSINYTNKESGFQSGQVEVIDQQLNFDNTYYFSYEVKESLKVIIVNGADASGYANSVYETDDFYTIENKNVQQLKADALSSGDLIVLNEIESISSGLRTRLQQLADQGKSICIIPANSPDKNSYNQILQTMSLPLLKEASSQSLRIKRIASEYDFFNGMFDGKVDNIRMPPLEKYFSSSIYTGANFNALVSMENDAPLFASSGGNRKVYMMYSSAQDEFSDFSKSALFSALLLRVGELSQRQQGLSLVLGSSDSYKPGLEIDQDEKIELSNGNYSFIPAMSFEDDQLSINVRQGSDNQSISAGNYDILYNEKKAGQIALNYSRDESELSYYSSTEIADYLTTLGANNMSFETLEDFEDIHQLSVEKPNEYWRILLTLALVFFITEMMIVLFWKL
jgi:hypothetical protein